MAPPLIELTQLTRVYQSGVDHKVVALDGVSLTIEAGEMVAIVGQSGSGKSTLMNILGCLDRPTSGSYRIAGTDTAALTPDELAELRREHFGFIFQRYHLMSDLTARDNVEVPAVYVGGTRNARRERAVALLNRLGLGERLDHRPSQLSGGQQQRVSIARALMNGGEIILADEPTGALDSKTGAEMMTLLKELNAEGHTIILITHEQHVAEHANRIIEIRDGKIVGDRRTKPAASVNAKKVPTFHGGGAATWAAVSYRVAEAARMAWLAMRVHKMRSFLTMLGIIIGITSVVSIVALGEGAQRTMIKEINAIGTNTIDIYPGRYWGDERAQRVQTLVPADADALAQQGYVHSVSPTVSASASVRYGAMSAMAQINGVSEQYFKVRDIELSHGAAFGRDSVMSGAQEVVIDENAHRQLFGLNENPLGKVVLLGKVPVRVVGVVKKKESLFGGGGQNLQILAPYTTVLWRMQGRTRLQSITVRVEDNVPMDVAAEAVASLLTLRHGDKDFMMQNVDDVRRTVERVTGILTLLIASIGLISLVVGGIGVMNIMLVSVSERITEIGVRTAVGARRSDILTQFLIEAVMVCLVGGAIGVLLTYGLASGINAILAGQFDMAVTPGSVLVAFIFSSAVGVIFGFVPARNAARLDPVDALARE